MAPAARDTSQAALRRGVAAAGSPLAVLSLAVPLLTGAGWALLVRRDVGALLDARVFRAWTAALAVALLCAIVRALAERRWPAAAIAAGLLAIAGQPEATRLWRFEGVASAGEGESSPRWLRTAGGPLAATPELGPVEFDPGAGAITVRAGGEGVRLVRGATATLRRAAITLVEIGVAPSFRIRAPDGAVVEEGLVELSGRDTGYIEVPSFPHRFYFAAPEGAATGGDEFPETLRIRIQRGKLRVFDGLLEPGAEGTFEGLGISWGEGARWARLDVRAAPRPLLALAGIVLVLEGALATWVLRRAR